MLNIKGKNKFLYNDEKSYYPREDDHIYYNVKLTNNQTTVTIPASYLESRTVSIIKERANQYYCAVVRFKVSAGSIPLFIFQTGDYYVNLIDTAGNPHVENCVWIVNNTGSSSGLNTINYVYNYSEWALSVTNAFNLAWLAIPMIIRPTAPPFVLYDPFTQLFSIYATDEYNSIPNEIGKTQIWMNFPTFNKFNFWTAYTNESVNPNIINVLIKRLGTNKIVANFAGTTGLNTDPAINGITYYQQAQEQKALYLLTDVDSIVLSTNMLPVNPEQFGNAQGVSSASTQNILTDFQPDIDNNISSRGYLIYTPFVYRYFDIPSDMPIINIDFKIFWRSIRGTLIPIYLFYNTTLDIKLLFKKKHTHVVVEK